MLIGRKPVHVSKQGERRLVVTVTSEERAEVGVCRDDDAVVNSRGFEDRLISRLAEVSLEDVHCVVAGGVERRGDKW